MASSANLLIEDEDSYELYQQRLAVLTKENVPTRHRYLKKHRYKKTKAELVGLEQKKEAEFWADYRNEQVKQQKELVEANEERESRIHELYQSNGIVAHKQTVHGLMIDAGSTGSRLHVYEWDPRVLLNEEDIQDAVSGNKLSFPGTDTRWTERLRPGLADFADRSDEDLIPALVEYLSPLLNFAKAVLHTKQDRWGTFPVYLRATAGMRILPAESRARIMDAVRDLFANNQTFSPFSFVPENARVLSGEEEAIYDWAGVNFLMGDLIEASEGAGTVVNPKKTHGALDLGGGSTQISFYEPKEDIMSNLFKLQVGQAKHWNVYAHSFLFYGMNEAIHRFESRLVAEKNTQERLVDGVYNPCMPGGSEMEIRSNIHVTGNNLMETWDAPINSSLGDGYYQAILKNHKATGDPDLCFQLTKDLLHLEQNMWCEFSHKGDCSIAGVYQPKLPDMDSEAFGEFVAFSNYHHVWKFLKLSDVASIEEVESATRKVCAMSHEQVRAWADPKKFPDSEIDSYCFRSAYVFQLLHNGFGFGMNDTIRATNVLNGHKVGWALGAMLYEINTLPWKYEMDQPTNLPILPPYTVDPPSVERIMLWGIVVALVASLVGLYVSRQRRNAKYAAYEVIKEEP
jgi:hypothetical protein